MEVYVAWDPENHPVHRLIQIFDLIRSGMWNVFASHPVPAVDPFRHMKAVAKQHEELCRGIRERFSSLNTGYQVLGEHCLAYFGSMREVTEATERNIKRVLESLSYCCPPKTVVSKECKLHVTLTDPPINTEVAKRCERAKATLIRLLSRHGECMQQNILERVHVKGELINLLPGRIGQVPEAYLSRNIIPHTEETPVSELDLKRPLHTWAGAKELADYYGLELETVRQRLKNHAKKYPYCRTEIVNSDRRRSDEKWQYRTSDVEHLFFEK